MSHQFFFRRLYVVERLVYYSMVFDVELKEERENASEKKEREIFLMKKVP